MYFRLRRPMSATFGNRRLRPNNFLPNRHRYSDIVPTGQSHPQKLLRNIHDAATNAIIRNVPAGWILEMPPLESSIFKPISEAIGSHPSTPGGRLTSKERPPDS